MPFAMTNTASVLVDYLSDDGNHYAIPMRDEFKGIIGMAAAAAGLPPLPKGVKTRKLHIECTELVDGKLKRRSYPFNEATVPAHLAVIGPKDGVSWRVRGFTGEKRRG